VESETNVGSEISGFSLVQRRAEGSKRVEKVIGIEKPVEKSRGVKRCKNEGKRQAESKNESERMRSMIMTMMMRV